MTKHSTKIQFYGVRGSLAVAGLKTAKLGGNTSCVLISHGKHHIILDAGTGIYKLGKRLVQESNKSIHLFLTHFHLDHITGLPFFAPLYKKNNTIHLYGPKSETQGLQKIMDALFLNDFFPVPFENLPTTIKLHPINEQKISIPPFELYAFPANHPGNTLGFQITVAGKKIIFLPDHEPIGKANHTNLPGLLYLKNLLPIIKNADVLIHDSQYFNSEYPRFRGWGHSDWKYPIQTSLKNNIRKTVLFHHAPEHSDSLLQKELLKIYKDFGLKKNSGKVVLATEGRTIRL